MDTMKHTSIVSGIGLPIVSGRAMEIKLANKPNTPKIMKGAFCPRNGVKRATWGARIPPTRADRFAHPKLKLLAGCTIHTSWSLSGLKVMCFLLRKQNTRSVWSIKHTFWTKVLYHCFITRVERRKLFLDCRENVLTVGNISEV